jgi:hypothetical protein
VIPDNRTVAIGIVWTLRARTIPLEKCAHAEPGAVLLVLALSGSLVAALMPA